MIGQIWHGWISQAGCDQSPADFNRKWMAQGLTTDCSQDEPQSALIAVEECVNMDIRVRLSIFTDEKAHSIWVSRIREKNYTQLDFSDANFKNT